MWHARDSRRRGAALRRSLIGVLIAAAFLAFAVPAASHVDASSTGSGRLPPRLDAALEEIEFAIDHEEAAGDALDEAGSKADDYAAAEIQDAMAHLRNARAALDAAVEAGEISGAEATAISNLIGRALRHDRDALGTIDEEDPIRDTLADLADALDVKEEVGDWIYYGDDLDFADLGCVINVQAFAGDVFAGFDKCTVAVVLLQLQLGFAFSRYSNGVVGEGNSLISQFPCLVALWVLTCRPPQALVPPNQYIFTAFGPFPTIKTHIHALAYGANGKVHRATFVLGTVQATNLALVTILRALTPYGFAATAGTPSAPRLGAGIDYVYQVKVENDGDGTAANATVDVEVPAGFMVKRLFPRSCSRTGSMVRCPLGVFEGGYAGLVSILGTSTKTGPGVFRASVTSEATEPSPDPGANSASTATKTYGVPRPSI